MTNDHYIEKLKKYIYSGPSRVPCYKLNVCKKNEKKKITF